MEPIIVVGSSNTDLVALVDRLPGEGETVMGESLQKFAGGKGANQAVAAARAGVPVAFAGAVGTDGFGVEAVRGFEKDGLDLRYLKRVEGIPSGTAMIAVDRKGQNQIVVAPGANDSVSLTDIECIDFSEFGIAVFQLEVPHKAVWLGLRRAKAAGCRTILNPAPASQIPKDIFQNVDYLVPNQHELELAAGSGTLEEQASAVLELGVKNLVVTLGADGVCCINADGKTAVPAPDFPVVDTVGAGDCFCGVFAAALSRGMVLEDALRHAVTAASISVGRPGAQASYVNWGEIREETKNA
ncbi:MAG: ribokinase [Verrucomicrobiota bacterium]